MRDGRHPILKKHTICKGAGLSGSFTHRKDVAVSIAAIIDKANQQVVDIFLKARPIWRDVQPAIDCIPGMKKNLILLPGPPITADKLLPGLRTAVCGAAVHEGLADTVEAAWQMVLSGDILIDAAQNYNCSNAASMATSASMPVFVVEDAVFGGTGYCTIHPGPSPRVLRWGIYGEDVEKNLRWIRDSYGPALGEAVRLSGGIDLISLLAKTAGMGDENHNRQPASSMALALHLIPYLLEVDRPHIKDTIKAFAANDRFFLQPLMAGIEGIMASAKKVKNASVMVGMGGNGVEFGIQIAGSGNAWYNTQAPLILGTFLDPRTKKEDLAGYLGDSCVTEVYGLGGMSAIAGPSYVRLTGSDFEEARRRTQKARAVSLAEHSFAPVPWNDFQGFPVCLDIRKVVAKNILPISHGGSGLKSGGQAGAGAAELPLECFKKALVGLSKAIEV